MAIDINDSASDYLKKLIVPITITFTYPNGESGEFKTSYPDTITETLEQLSPGSFIETRPPEWIKKWLGDEK